MGYHIVRYSHSGAFVGVVSGCGKNKGTWDSEHSRSSAYRIAKQLNQDCQGAVHKVEVIGQ